MFCKNCGRQVPDDTMFCPGCGEDLSAESRIVRGVNNVFDATDRELGGSVNDVQQSFGGIQQSYGGIQQSYGGGQQSYGGGQQRMPYSGGIKLKDDRSLLVCILLALVTCGIYGYYFVYKIAADVNVACEGDGEKTSGLLAFILLSMVTCGIYAWIWYYKLGNRLASNAGRYGLVFQENGTTILLWYVFGVMLCGIGPFIAMNIIIKNTNKIFNAYNRANNLI